MSRRALRPEPGTAGWRARARRAAAPGGRRGHAPASAQRLVLARRRRPGRAGWGRWPTGAARPAARSPEPSGGSTSWKQARELRASIPADLCQAASRSRSRGGASASTGGSGAARPVSQAWVAVSLARRRRLGRSTGRAANVDLAAPRRASPSTRSVRTCAYHQGSRLRVPITGKAGSQDRRERARDRAEPLQVHAARHRQPTWLDVTGRVMHGARQEAATDH